MTRFKAGVTLAVAVLGAGVSAASAEPDALPSFAKPGFAVAVGSTDRPAAQPVAADAPSALAAKPAPVPAKPSPSFPTTIPEAQARAAAQEAPPETWPQEEIDLAKARCTQLLKGIDVVAVPEEPVREGECGAPAPVRIVSVGRKPEITFSPPALVTCDMAVALHTWLKKELQPLARKHLGSEIVRVETMSDYSCRNAYGRVKTRLSEHGRANALDIRGFVTAKADPVAVLDDWGMTQRELIALAKTKAKEQARQAATAGPATEPTRPTGPIRPAQGSPSQDVARGTIADGLPRASIAIPGVGEPIETPSSIGFGMSRLGGPKSAEGPKTAEAARIPQKQAAAAPVDPVAGRRKFLHEAHASACRIFGTVLGPEANNAHRNHFHVDLAERQTGAFCE